MLRILFASLSLIFCGCIETSESETTSELFTELEAGELVYLLDWDVGGIERTENGWSTTNNLGYEIQVETGQLVSARAELIACDEDAQLSQIKNSPLSFTSLLGEWLTNIILPKSAWAGHGEPENPSAIESSVTEDFVEAQPTIFGYTKLSGGLYCSVHYLIARPDKQSEESESNDIQSSMFSVVLTGRYRASSQRPLIDFSISTTLANGRIDPLLTSDLSSIRFSPTRSGASIRITRNLDQIFADLDFENMSSEEIDFQIVKNVVNGTQIRIESNEAVVPRDK